MVSSKCPGQDMRYWTYDSIVEADCPDCGNSMEFWKTDIRLRCRNCGKMVVNKKFNLGCAAWCSFAEQCLGEAAKGYKPESIKRKLEVVAGRYLKGDEKKEVDKILDNSAQIASQEGKEVLAVVASAVFERIMKKHGREEVEDIIDGMIEKGEINPDIAGKLKEEVLHND